VVLQPRLRRNAAGLGCPLFARHYWGDHCFVFFSSRYLDVSVPWVCSLSGDWSSTSRVAPFGDPRITGYYAPPRGLSQPIASFIASESQGIHLTPLVTFQPSRGYARWTDLSVCFGLSDNKSKNGLPWMGAVENIGVEPMTSCLQSRRSSQLS
jgi:hypothetical protein